ncbi:MAG: radical SAM protein [Chitinophagaceae bacterium]|jgi:radical SAM superfamily enzyme YgiQ (UPF0313 family)
MSNATVFLITPPFTQLNTPYPATAYLKGFLNTQNISSAQADLGIEVILHLFSRKGLTHLFDSVAAQNKTYNANISRILKLRPLYLKTIDTVIEFLQNKNPTLAHLICTGNYLPEASRFEQISDLEWAFGAMGIQDKARHLATLYLEDLSDFIVATTDAHFGFSRYAERLSRSAHSFDELYAELYKSETFIDELTLELLSKKMKSVQPDLVAISAPFPGNMYSAFRCAQWIKKHYPNTKICLGGGFANTELRSVSDIRVFEFFDFITLDDGEAPITQLLEYIKGKLPQELLKRTLLCDGQKVVYRNGSLMPDFKQKDIGTPDYTGLGLNDYLSVIEIANPMHRLWSDGRWNKLTLAHGCYWGKCTFCDISLDYIRHYEAASAEILVNRIEELIAQTGNNGFHFVDEAAPPALMREVALEILRRGLSVVWWTNIRFEKSFTHDLCQLLAASGCIAVSGGLEVASDRLLELIQKGVTVTQVAKVADNFTEAGIMVHAYLMYGFPTQTAQETIDSLEIVRQLFQNNILQSGFWHQFAMTAHSPVGLMPEQFKVKKVTEAIGTFANNDIEHIDPTGARHELFSEGLRKSLFNYMHGMCFDFPLQEWFDFKVPKTTIHPRHIEKELGQYVEFEPKASSKMVWIGAEPELKTSNRKGQIIASIILHSGREMMNIDLKQNISEWLMPWLQNLSIQNKKLQHFGEFQSDFETNNLGSFDTFWHSEPMLELRRMGLFVL